MTNSKRKRPCIIQIDKDTHKILKIMSASQNRPMGEIAECLIKREYRKMLKREQLNISIRRNWRGEVIRNDEKRILRKMEGRKQRRNHNF